ncbi:hypothetical protein OF83DRAFT_1149128 [Amylostereum chailletii]|nr:hypothetical protein OF83DRAFT_1149128 [Amylostereum chailletii]
MLLSIRHQFSLALQNAFFKVTLNRFSTAFFVLSFVYCFAQGITQAFLFSVDTRWRTFTSEVVGHANINTTVFLQYTLHYTWEICNDTPVSGVAGACVPFYNWHQANATTIPPFFRRDDEGFGSLTQSSTYAVQPLDDARWIIEDGTPSRLVVSSATNENGTFVVVSQHDTSNSITLDPVCTRTMLYPDQKLDQYSREDASLIAAHFWLFGLALFALVYESIPHLIALAFARLLATAWSAYAIWRTINLGQRLDRLVGPGTPCHLNIFPAYFAERVRFQIADLVLHATALLLVLVLSWRLARTYQNATFARACPPAHILKIYRYFLAVFVCLQLAVFFLVVAMSLWIDQLVNGAIADLSWHTGVYEALFISTTVFLLPWIATGWFSIRRENARLTLAFLVTAFIFIAAWALMFYSQVYRFTFVDWPFFGSITLTAFVVMVLSMVFALLCRSNFDRGLAHFLYVEKALADSDFEPEVFARDPEKAALPYGAGPAGWERAERDSPLSVTPEKRIELTLSLASDELSDDEDDLKGSKTNILSRLDFEKR